MAKLKKPSEFEFATIQMRGIIISHTIYIERKIDEFLSNHFCEKMERKNELCELLLFTERITFDMKKQMLYAIVKEHYKQFIKDNETFLQDMEAIAPHRNIFAHLEIDLSMCQPGTGNERIVFKKYKSGKFKPEVYTRDQIGTLSSQMRNVMESMDRLITAIPPLA